MPSFLLLFILLQVSISFVQNNIKVSLQQTIENVQSLYLVDAFHNGVVEPLYEGSVVLLDDYQGTEIGE